VSYRSTRDIYAAAHADREAAAKLIDYAKGVVLPEYTDEALRLLLQHHEPGVREWATLLLSVPAEQRQNIEAEVMRRSTRTTYHRTISGLYESLSTHVASPSTTREAVVAEYLAEETR
jgi:hypothetical protein